jgi:hypothetical protein
MEFQISNLKSQITVSLRGSVVSSASHGHRASTVPGSLFAQRRRVLVHVKAFVLSDCSATKQQNTNRHECTRIFTNPDNALFRFHS